MTLDEIKSAVKAGKQVYWCTPAYQVLEAKGQWLIRCSINGHCIGLTCTDEKTLNAPEDEFFILNLPNNRLSQIA
jgi:hypothetical protein